MRSITPASCRSAPIGMVTGSNGFFRASWHAFNVADQSVRSLSNWLKNSTHGNRKSSTTARIDSRSERDAGFPDHDDHPVYCAQGRFRFTNKPSRPRGIDNIEDPVLRGKMRDGAPDRYLAMDLLRLEIRHGVSLEHRSHRRKNTGRMKQCFDERCLTRTG